MLKIDVANLYMDISTGHKHLLSGHFYKALSLAVRIHVGPSAFHCLRVFEFIRTLTLSAGQHTLKNKMDFVQAAHSLNSTV